MSEERYKNGKIYTIRYRGDDSLIYVGSTCLPLYKRWHSHKSTCFSENSKCHLYIYTKIRETNDFNNWYIELYEEYPCENKEQLLKREGEIIREIGTLNSLIAGRTKKEWTEENKEKVSKQKKQWAEENKEKVSEKLKQYRTDNKEKLSEHMKQYYNENKNKILDYHKQYNEENKEKISEKRKLLYQINKEKISEYRKEKIVCVCGCEINKRTLKQHHTN